VRRLAAPKPAAAQIIPVAALIVALASCVQQAPAPRPAPVPPPPPPAPAPPAPVAAVLTLDGAGRQGGTILGRTTPGATLTLDGRRVPVAPDGRFLIAFDRDAAPGATLVAQVATGPATTRTLAIAPGGWRIEQINAPLRAGKSSAEFARLRPAELAQINAARAVDQESDGWRQRFRWPVTGRRSGQFGAQRVYQGTPGSYHSGTDVAVPAGTPLVAPADGVVVLATDHAFTLEGNLVILDHGMGLNSAFLHLSRIDVRAGQRVRQGEPIGRVGATGRATGPHMHWGMKWRDTRIDPALLAGAME
jgi:murein DD-endopeptidase MepM/ murein hydrolase activator NlpD